MRTSLITGEAPVAPNGIKRPRIALVSPFNAAAAAAIPPSAALWERLTLRLLLLLTGLISVVVMDYNSENAVCQALQMLRIEFFISSS